MSDFHKNDQFCDPPLFRPINPQKETIDLLFKSNRIYKHVTNFMTPLRHILPHVDVINLWFRMFHFENIWNISTSFKKFYSFDERNLNKKENKIYIRLRRMVCRHF